MRIKIGARSSPLSRAQVEEFSKEWIQYHPFLILDPVYVESPGDRDQKTSLRSLEKTDFFTRDLDEMLLAKTIRIAVHSAKDLPDPIPHGLTVAALTRGVDPRDSLVFRQGESLEALRSGALIGTSTVRREETVRQLRSDISFVDLRGQIGKRLAKLEEGDVDGVVIAEAALIRLQLTHLNRIFLPRATNPLQGRLAVVAVSEDSQIMHLLNCLS